jgi:hypothetical protein
MPAGFDVDKQRSMRLDLFIAPMQHEIGGD